MHSPNRIWSTDFGFYRRTCSVNQAREGGTGNCISPSDEKLYRFIRQRSDFEDLTFQEYNEEKLGKT